MCDEGANDAELYGFCTATCKDQFAQCTPDENKNPVCLCIPPRTEDPVLLQCSESFSSKSSSCKIYYLLVLVNFDVMLKSSSVDTFSFQLTNVMVEEVS